MYHELTNLLPNESRRAFKREYFLRLLTVSLLMLATATAMGAAMLLPAYLSLMQERAVKEADLARLSALLGNTQEKEVGERLSALARDAEHLSRLADRPSTSGAVRMILGVPKEGIEIRHIAFRSASGGSHTVAVSGTAATRAALQHYDQALAALPSVESTDLPIGTYAKETDLEFIITLKGQFTP